MPLHGDDVLKRKYTHRHTQEIRVKGFPFTCLWKSLKCREFVVNFKQRFEKKITNKTHQIT